MSDDKKIRYGVIGLGNIAQVAVLPAFGHAKENSVLSAIVSSSERKRAELAERFDVEHAVSYDEFDRLVAEKAIDAVYIALPNHLHAEWAVRAASAGLHVLCEKPMALDENELAKGDQFAPELIYFSRCILEQKTPEPSGEEGLADVRVLRAIMQSASEGHPVRFVPSVKAQRPEPDMRMHKRPVSEQETIDAPSPSSD